VREHLTERQILAWQFNEQTAEDRQHVAECVECRAEVVKLDRALAAYRASVHSWSGAHQPVARRWAAPSRWQMARRTTLQWASAAAVALAVIVPVYTHRVIEERNQQRALADQALLEQVDREVSQTIPDTMEPLTDLVQWDTTDAAETGTLGKKGKTQ
jgi:hypothetical protein